MIYILYVDQKVWSTRIYVSQRTSIYLIIGTKFGPFFSLERNRHVLERAVYFGKFVNANKFGK